jgi:flagellar M-ring protein FliF
LIDQDVEWQGKGKERKRVLIPPSAEKLKAIHDVVAGVLGISTDRGDQLVIETLPFEQTRNAEDTAGDSQAKPNGSAKLTVKDLMADKRILIGAGTALLFIILLLGFVLRKPKASAASAQLNEQPAILPGRADSQVGSAAIANSKQVEGKEGATKAENEAAAAKALADAIPSLMLPEMTSHTKQLLDQLRNSVLTHPDVAINVIRSWMEEI